MKSWLAKRRLVRSLRRTRPRPSRAFLRAQISRLEAVGNGRRRSRRTAYAAGLAAAALLVLAGAMLAAGGGTRASDVVEAVKLGSLLSSHTDGTPRDDQYGGVAQGCTPGYWKNHTDSWSATGYSTGQTVGSVFSASGFPTLAGATLLEALGFGGGPGATGGAQILLRAAVAALLNAADPGIDYTKTPTEVISAVNSALASGDRDTMLALAGELDTANNAGCPLS